MGCECCREFNPKWYNSCKIGNDIPYKGTYIAPCGMDFNKGSNYTAPKPKKKRRRK
jgi:hypothetical protein